MTQYSVHLNPNPRTSANIPYLLNVQSDTLDNLATRVVVPLVRTSAMGQAATHINPMFEIDGTRVVMSTAELAGIPLPALGRQITTLEAHRTEIIGALDFLLTGV